MKIQGGVNIRSAWYDRNPIKVVASVGDVLNVGNKAIITPEYTVPANKKAIVRSITFTAYLITATSSNPALFMRVNITPNGEALEEIDVGCFYNIASSPVGSLVINDYCILLAGDVFNVQHSTNILNGSYQGCCSYSIDEYDA